MLKKILFVLVALIAAVAVLIAVQPAHYSVKRSGVIAAPPEAVFALVNDFHNWDAWSPWAKLDPAMKTTYSGSASGVGSVYEWSGNDEVGAGRMTITDSRPNEHVRINLEFLRPFESASTTEFAFAPAQGGTAVDWTMSGENNFMGKAFALFVGMDKAIGGDFEKGLAQMKSAAEKR